MLNVHLMSAQPVTRYAVFGIAVWVGMLVFSLSVEMGYIVSKHFAGNSKAVTPCFSRQLTSPST